MRSRPLFIPGLQFRRGKYALVLTSVSGRNVGCGIRVADPPRPPSASPAQRVELVLERKVVGGAAPSGPALRRVDQWMCVSQDPAYTGGAELRRLTERPGGPAGWEDGGGSPGQRRCREAGRGRPKCAA